MAFAQNSPRPGPLTSMHRQYQLAVTHPSKHPENWNLF